MQARAIYLYPSGLYEGGKTSNTTAPTANYSNVHLRNIELLYGSYTRSLYRYIPTNKKKNERSGVCIGILGNV